MDLLDGYLILTEGTLVFYQAATQAQTPTITILGNIYSLQIHQKKLSKRVTAVNLRYDAATVQLFGLIAYQEGGIYQLRYCATQECQQEDLNSKLGCMTGYFMSSTPLLCSKCHESCTDCDGAADVCRDCTSKYTSIAEYLSSGLIYRSCSCKPELFVDESTLCCDRTVGEIPITGLLVCASCGQNCSSCISREGVFECLDDTLKKVSDSRVIKSTCFSNFVQNKKFCEDQGVSLILVDCESDPRSELIINLTLSLENNISDEFFAAIKNQN